MERKIIKYQCPKCGCEDSYENKTKYSIAGECVSCGEMTFYNKINDYDMPIPPTVKCPYCQSINTKKITNLSKAGSVAMFGVFAIGKTTKEWHCNNCKSDF